MPDIQDVVRSSQSTLKNVNVLVGRLNNIVSAVEDQKGSVGKLIYDKQLYNNLNSSVKQVNGMLTDVSSGHGSLGKLLTDDTLYQPGQHNPRQNEHGGRQPSTTATERSASCFTILRFTTTPTRLWPRPMR